MQLTTFKIWVAHDKVLTSLGREIFGTVWFIVQLKLIMKQSEIKFHLRHNKNTAALVVYIYNGKDWAKQRTLELPYDMDTNLY